jgi:hypothetical protein
MIDEKELSTALHDLAERDEAGIPPVQRLLRRGHRARTGRAALAVTATATAGALVAAAVGAAPHRAGRPVPLALAAQNSTQTPFRFTITGTTRLAGHTQTMTPATGGYDSARHRGYWKQGYFEMRQVGADCFARYVVDGAAPNSWELVHSGCWSISAGSIDSVLTSSSPGDLLDKLKTLGSVTYAGRTGSGSHAVDRYRFSYTEDSGVIVTLSYTGAVEIDVATGRITQVSFQIKVKQSNPDFQVKMASEQQLVFSFHDYGAPVDVTAPDDVQPPGPSSYPTNSPTSTR